MDAVVKTLRYIEKEPPASAPLPASSKYGLHALKLFLHLKPKTFPEHAKLSTLLLQQKTVPDVLLSPMPASKTSTIDKSPSLCLQGIQLALQAPQDLSALVLASLLVINLNRDKVSFKQPHTWENMHLQLAKKFLDVAALPLSAVFAEYCRLLMHYHLHLVLASLNFIPKSSSTTKRIEWARIRAKFQCHVPTLPPFMEKLIVVCLQMQLHERDIAVLVTEDLPPKCMTKTTWDMAYRLIWKSATGLEKAGDDPHVVLRLRAHGLRSLAYSQSPWSTFLQQLHRTGVLFKKHANASCAPLYIDMAPRWQHLLAQQPTENEATTWPVLLQWLEHWATVDKASVTPVLQWVKANMLPQDGRWASLLHLLHLLTAPAASSDDVEGALDCLGADLPLPMLPVALRFLKRLVALHSAGYPRLLEWTTRLRQGTSSPVDRDKLLQEELFCIRMCIRGSLEAPIAMLGYIERAMGLHEALLQPQPSAATAAAFTAVVSDATIAAVQWFKQEQYQAVVQLRGLAELHSPKLLAVVGAAHHKMHNTPLALEALEAAVAADATALDKYMVVVLEAPSDSMLASAARVLVQCPAQLFVNQLRLHTDKWLRHLRRSPCQDTRERLGAALDMEALADASALGHVLRQRRRALADLYVQHDAARWLQSAEELVALLPPEANPEVCGWRAILRVERVMAASYATAACDIMFDQIRTDLDVAIKGLPAAPTHGYVEALAGACQLLGWTSFYERIQGPQTDSVAQADKLLGTGDVDAALTLVCAARDALTPAAGDDETGFFETRRVHLAVARASCAKGLYDDALGALKAALKSCFQHVYHLGVDTVLVETRDAGKMYFQPIQANGWALLHDTLSCLGLLGDVYSKLGVPSKAEVYLRRAQTLAAGLDHRIVCGRAIALRGARLEMQRNHLTVAQSAVERLVPIASDDVLQEVAWMAQACDENLFEGDVLHVQSCYGPAQKSYKLAKHRVIPYYQRTKRLIGIVGRSYRKLAENACRAYYHSKSGADAFPLDAITAFQKALKLSMSVVETTQTQHNVGLAVYHRARTQTDGKRLELLSQSVHALREAWHHAVRMARPHLAHRVCRDLSLALVETAQHTDAAMQFKLHWQMALLQSQGVRVDRGNPATDEAPSAAAEHLVQRADAFQRTFEQAGLPPEWNFVYLSLTTSKELVLHRIQANGTTPITVAVPSSVFPMESILAALQKIIAASNETLSGHTADEAHAWSSTQKKQWWNQRNHLDQQLQLLLEKAQAKLGFYASLFLGRPAVLPEAVVAAIASVQAQSGALSLRQQELLVAVFYALHQQRLSRNVALAGLRAVVPDVNLSLVKFPVHAATTAPGPTILICDEKVHAFPWEGLCPGLAVTRMTSMAAVLRDRRLALPPVSKHRVRYMINPSGDLVATEGVLAPYLTQAARAWQWEGVMGRLSLEEAGARMQTYVTTSDVFIYSGHGSGEVFVHRDVLAGFAQASVALLLGCSSGKLKQEGIFLPEGMLLSYLAAKSRAVVGMLWDVTDRDIDRLSLKLLGLWFDGHESLAAALATARGECKLKSLNGLAAVCYGLPLHIDTPDAPMKMSTKGKCEKATGPKTVCEFQLDPKDDGYWEEADDEAETTKELRRELLDAELRRDIARLNAITRKYNKMHKS
ncbi:separin [Achlya hypogyna]|uniref:separase n=1 Tax=Achlya hypogyna TaxID=1202772 RepID=A0A1V9Z339_ACHHY|nr:separin [Achlya hypogyna]